MAEVKTSDSGDTAPDRAVEAQKAPKNTSVAEDWGVRSSGGHQKGTPPPPGGQFRGSRGHPPGGQFWGPGDTFWDV